MNIIKPSRRHFLKYFGAAGTAAMLLEPQGLFAEALTTTPSATEGPYYPPNLPLDTDNDLVVINSNLTSAVGQITYLSGRVLSATGEPVRNAHVEIWHADTSGAYIHPSSAGYANRDQNFQGFGRFVTASNGEYFFRTIKPGLYTGRTRHIHFKVKLAGSADFTSQIFFLGEPANASDMVLTGIPTGKQRASVIVPFASVEGSTINAIAARFDIVLSNTPASMPIMALANTTNAGRNPAFRAGDSWRLDLSEATAGFPVFLRLWKDSIDLGISGPYGTTDSGGAWSLTGSYGANDSGYWQVQGVVGSNSSSERSTPIAIQVGA